MLGQQSSYPENRLYQLQIDLDHPRKTYVCWGAEQSDMLASTYSRLETGQVSLQLQTQKCDCYTIVIAVGDLFNSRELTYNSIAQKLEMIRGLSDYSRNVVEKLLDFIIEKDSLEKSQEVRMGKRFEELNKIKG